LAVNSGAFWPACNNAMVLYVYFVDMMLSRQKKTDPAIKSFGKFSETVDTLHTEAAAPVTG
jgi:hypothetical protein